MTFFEISARTMALATALALSACATKNNGFRDNAGVDTIYKADVSFEERTHPVSFASGKLAAGEEAALASFIAASGLSYSDRLTLRTSEPNLATDYRQSINTVLGRYGLSIGNVETVPGLRTGAAMLSASRATVKLPDCGNQSGPHAFNVNNENMNNYGCASRSNLAAMAANPADLISGNTLSGQSADVTAKPVNGWGGHELSGVKQTSGDWTPQGPAAPPK